MAGLILFVARFLFIFFLPKKMLVGGGGVVGSRVQKIDVKKKCNYGGVVGDSILISIPDRIQYCLPYILAEMSLKKNIYTPEQA